jgi:hypothetical protein
MRPRLLDGVRHVECQEESSIHDSAEWRFRQVRDAWILPYGQRPVLTAVAG